MALEITEQMVLDYLLRDVDLPEGLRVVSVKFDPRSRELRHCELEKDAQAIAVGDYLLDDGSIVHSSASWLEIHLGG